ncbi:MAG TPA: DPP IV N-terminal domain-containing protein, partial [Thermoanaerobaculia bacterium]
MLLALLIAAGAGSPPADRDFQFLQDYTQTKRWSLGRPVKVQPTPDGTAVLFLRSPPRTQEPRLFRFEVATGETKELITPDQVLAGKAEELSAEERARRERMRITGRGFTGFDLSRDGKLVLVTLSGRAFVLPVAGGAAKEVASPGPKGEPVFDPKLSPDGSKVSFVRSGELWVAKIDGGARQITRGATALVTHAQAEFVAQEELRRFTGYWWSPDSKWLVYEEADNRGVEKLWFGDPARPEIAVEPTPYP